MVISRLCPDTNMETDSIVFLSESGVIMKPQTSTFHYGFTGKTRQLA
jgi:hypothetical protein